MKNIKTITLSLLVSGLMLSGCNDFLTINPKTEIAEDQLLNSETGFKDALTGVYTLMRSDMTYGKAMTMGYLEYLVSSWDATGGAEAALGRFDYTNEAAESILSAMFAKQYNTIANINSILDRIDDKKSVFKPGLYEMTKGECLALRAYCHFDMLRLFGPIPSNPSVGNNLPYVTTLSQQPNNHLSFADFQVKLLQDLTEAENLLKSVDPVITYSAAELKTKAQKDSYFYTRQIKMNYYAVKALQARVYLWFNNKPKAYECAKAVLDAKNTDATPKFRLGNVTDLTTAKDYSMTCEQIFGLHDFLMSNKYNDYFTSGQLKKSTTQSMIKILLYENTNVDIREMNLWEQVFQNGSTTVRVYIPKKYKAEKVEDAGGGLIPMLRTSEMYFIAIETTTSQTEAQTLWNAFRTSRALPANTLPTDPGLIQAALIKEYRKELYAEGQAFYAYKRVNAPLTSIVFAPTTATVNYLPPMPKSETLTQ